jgi:hypothetical protein
MNVIFAIAKSASGDPGPGIATALSEDNIDETLAQTRHFRPAIRRTGR